MATAFDLLFILILLVVNARTLLIPNVITYPGAVLGLLAHVLTGRAGFDAWLLSLLGIGSATTGALLSAFAGLVLGIALVTCLNSVASRLRGSRVVGYADSKMVGMAGTYLGVSAAAAIAVLGFCILALVAAFQFALRRDPWQMPSGFLWGVPALGFAVILLAGSFSTSGTL